MIDGLDLDNRAALTPREAEMLDVVVAYYRATQEPCPASIVARRVAVSYSRVRRDGFRALHRKGWLLTDSSPATPRLSDRG